MRRIPSRRILNLLTLLLLGCAQVVAIGAEETPQRVDSRPRPAAKSEVRPVPPLKLSRPSEPSATLDGIDFRSQPPGQLLNSARKAADEKRDQVAATAQYWFFRKTNQGRYNLACYLARAGQVDAAFYWLQEAALEEGIDPQHALRDEDLDSLRNDGRWTQVLSFLQACQRYYESGKFAYTTLILPTGYEKGRPIPAVIWMHGLGSRPDDFDNRSSQKFADQLNVALIGPSGTRSRGPRSFVWSEDIKKDTRRVRDALAEVSDRVTIEKGKVILLGFSQGAGAAIEIAVRYPEEYAGAIILSPGGIPRLQSVRPSPLLSKRSFVISYGASEHPGVVYVAKNANDWLRRARSHVEYRPIPDLSAHTFPADFNDRFPEWVHFILGGRQDKERIQN